MVGGLLGHAAENGAQGSFGSAHDDWVFEACDEQDAVLVHEDLNARHGGVLALHDFSYIFLDLCAPLLHPELDVLEGWAWLGEVCDEGLGFAFCKAYGRQLAEEERIHFGVEPKVGGVATRERDSNLFIGRTTRNDNN